MRETTYWPKLCVIQMASPEEAFIIDALAPDLDLAAVLRADADEKVMKVFHAARQDIEIVYHLGGLIPHPVFDTQVAAMVCGFGDSISYDQLVQRTDRRANRQVVALHRLEPAAAVRAHRSNMRSPTSPTSATSITRSPPGSTSRSAPTGCARRWRC